MKALITGFEPFGGENINPSYEIVKRLPDQLDDCDIIKIEIPTVFGKSINKLAELIKENEPDFVICIGQAGGESTMRLEKVAINLNEARIPDNDGNQPQGEAIDADGETAYFSNLPLKGIVRNLIDEGIPASISYTAGTFVCNHIFYGLMNVIKKEGYGIKGGFVHVPYLPEQVVDKKATAHMTLDMMVKAIEIAIKTTCDLDQDIEGDGGALH